MRTILLLVASNVFMTLAWYGHLKWEFLQGRSMLFVILFSWALAFFEYCLMVPANRLGYVSGQWSGYQLKILQEAISISVFAVFATLVLKEKIAWNHAVSFGLIMLAVYFATAFNSSTPPTH